MGASYRPIALISHLSKLMERLMRGPMVKFMEDHGLLDSSQYGARARRSTLSQLLIQYDKVLTLLENGGNCDLIFLDFVRYLTKWIIASF